MQTKKKFWTQKEHKLVNAGTFSMSMNEEGKKKNNVSKFEKTRETLHSCHLEGDECKPQSEYLQKHKKTSQQWQ